MSLLLEMIGEEWVTPTEREILTLYQTEVLAAVRRFGSVKNAASKLGRGEKAVSMMLYRIRLRGVER